ncbi:transcription elongation factor 1 homolog isoform X1 [Girardinichthys multiradiatus]|uniref:transcription elongation factor 1 homolog isoform X1 n=1 Tax=Girardinichthys multiradiatus TaxID=208333 RepID=UPI001FAE34DE|nr:transcription elongation factor 1 homolog isoform X1 [Girardinichthys multiradiatus]
MLAAASFEASIVCAVVSILIGPHFRKWMKLLQTFKELYWLSVGIKKRVISDTMGRRKSKRKPPPKKKMTGNLDTQFTCPFCNHEKSCDVKMERTRNTGIISCSVCLEEFQTPITYLSEPVDVYSDWIDACEAANQ